METPNTGLQPGLDALSVQVKANTDAEDSAVILINGFQARLNAAVAAAAAAGATPAQLVQLTTFQSDLKSHADTLAADVVANTPAAA